MNMLTSRLNAYRLALTIITTVVILVLAAPARSDHVRFDTGIAVTPKNFPKHTPQDIDQAFQLAAELGKHAVFIFQWHELDLTTVKLLLDKAKQSGLTPILGLSPTSLDQGRKELDIPASVRAKAGNAISFSNPVIRSEFITAAKELAQLKPPYLCLATEINFLGLQRLDEYLHFVSLYKEAYAEVKKISPQTKVFVSFQWEWIRIVDAKAPHNIKEHSKIITVFKPALDVVGLTTYPSPYHDTAWKLPDDYYSWVYHHIDPTDTVVYMETGWPTSATGSNAEQRDYLKRLPMLLAKVNTSIVAWSLLHDVNLPEFDANLNTTGLLSNAGRKKPAFNVFKSLRQ